jgi:hypothetical protein
MPLMGSIFQLNLNSVHVQSTTIFSFLFYDGQVGVFSIGSLLKISGFLFFNSTWDVPRTLSSLLRVDLLSWRFVLKLGRLNANFFFKFILEPVILRLSILRKFLDLFAFDCSG